MPKANPEGFQGEIWTQGLLPGSGVKKILANYLAALPSGSTKKWNPESGKGRGITETETEYGIKYLWQKIHIAEIMIFSTNLILFQSIKQSLIILSIGDFQVYSLKQTLRIFT